MAAICYVRVSTEEQAKHAYNLPTQEKKVLDFCKQQGWSVLQLFAEKGQSARSTDRPAFQRMMEYCHKHKSKVSQVVVADLSRFARNVLDQGEALARLQQLGIKVVSVDEPITDDTAAGKLARNMLGSMNQFFSDSLSERIKYRMDAGLKEGRFLHLAPIGYLNKDKAVVVDPERGPLIRQAFELIASGNYSTTDAVLKLMTGLGLRTKRGAIMTKQSWGRLLNNQFYCAWIVGKDIRVRGKHEPLISEVTFQRVQDRINGKSRPHQRLNDDFPLRGVVQCAGCGKNLTAGLVKGRKEAYPRYWCWNSKCPKKVGASKEEVEGRFIALLGGLGPSAELLAKLPQIAAGMWQERKARVAKDAEKLSKLRGDQQTLNQKTVRAKIEGHISEEDFRMMKAEIEAETRRIDEQITALDSERSTIKQLIDEAKADSINFAKAWRNGTTGQKHEIVRGLFPQGLPYSSEKGFFEPANERLMLSKEKWLDELFAGEDAENEIGAGDGI
jgi:site-specific DNA recombinase